MLHGMYVPLYEFEASMPCQLPSADQETCKVRCGCSSSHHSAAPLHLERKVRRGILESIYIRACNL